MPKSNTSKFVKIGEASKNLGVSIDTLRRWEKAGKIEVIRTPGGTRLYSTSNLNDLTKSPVRYQRAELPKPQLSTVEELIQHLESTTPDEPAKDLFIDEREIEPEELSVYTEAEIPSNSFTPEESKPTPGVFSRRSYAFTAFSGVVACLIIASLLFARMNNFQGLFTNTNKTTAKIEDFKSKSGVLAAETAGFYLNIKSDVTIEEDLAVGGSINGLTLTPNSDGFTVAGGTSASRKLTVLNGDVTLDQDVSTKASPSFVDLKLTATTKQINMGGAGTLTWTPSGTQVITFPNATGIVVLDTATQTITNKNISGSSNTITSIPNSALTNKGITITPGANLSGGGEIELGGSGTLALKDSITLASIIASGNISAATLTGTNYLTLSQTTAPSTTTDKLYNVSGALLWNGTDITSGGALPVGTSGQTIYHNGVAWTATSNLFNNGTNIGIGTALPGQALEVNGAGYFSSGTYIGANNTNNLISSASTGASSTQLYIGNLPIATVGGGGSGSITGTTNQVGYFIGTNTLGGSNNLWFNGSNVGIGTTNPTSKLDVNGNIAATTFNSIGLTGTAGTTMTFPTISDTLAGLGQNQTFSGINTFSGSSIFDGNLLFGGSTGILGSSGNVGVGTTQPNASALMELSSSSQGFLAPRMTQTQRDAISSPANGLMIYNTDAKIFNVYDSGANGWTTINGGTAGHVAWSDIINPAGNLVLSMNTYTTALTWGNTTGANNLFSLTDTASNSGTGNLLDITTAASSNVNPLHIKATGTEALFINKSGNVGVGTTNPLQKLEVTGAGYFSSGAYIGANNTNNLISTASTGASSTQLYIGNLPIATVGGGGSGSITGTTNQVGYFTGTNTLGGSNNFWFNGTNVGIGTTSPTALLELSKSSNAVPLTLRSFQSLVSGNYTGLQFSIADNSVTTDTYKKGGIFYVDNGTGYGFGDIYFANNNTATDANASIADAKMVILNSGNVGIGTTAPSSPLSVYSNSDSTGTLYLADLKRNYTNESGSVRGNGLLFSDMNSSQATIVALRQSSINNYNSDLAFSTNNGSSGSDLQERMRILNNGNVGIGTTAPLAKLEVNGDIKLATTGTLDFGTAVTGTDRELIRFYDSNNGLYFNNNSNSTGGLIIKVYDGDANDRLFSVKGSSGTTRFSVGALTGNGYFSGNVGIGTTNPLQALEVNGAGYFSSGTYIGANNSNNLISSVSTGASSTQLYIGNLPIATVGGGGSGSITGATNQVGYFTGTDTLGGSNNFWFNGTNVGIGTTNPNNKLEVAATTVDLGLSVTGSQSDLGIRIKNSATSGNEWYIDSAASTSSYGPGNFVITKLLDANPKFVISDGGNVGIGTTTPIEKLEVAGNILLGNNQFFMQRNATGAEVNILGLDNFNNERLFANGNLYISPDANNTTYLNYNNTSPVQIGDGTHATNLYVPDGNVGIGTGPNNLLDIVQNTDTGKALSVYRNKAAANTDSPVVSFIQDNAGDDQSLLYLSNAGTANSLSISNSGTGNLALLDSTNTSSNGMLIDLQSSSASQYALRTTSNNGATNGLWVGGDGNVGIGTTNPLQVLEVNGAGYFSSGTYIGANNSNNLISTASTGASSTQLYIGNLPIATAGGGGSGSITGSTNQVGYFTGTNTLGGSNNLWFNGSNVGIGTTGPVAKLDVRSGYINVDYGYGIRISNQSGPTSEGGNNTWPSGTSNLITNGFIGGEDTVSLFTPGSIRSAAVMTLKSSGNVGIGTTTPSQKLDVAGNINLNTSNGTNALFSTYQGAYSDGYNIFIGGGGQNSIGAVGEGWLGSYNTAYGVDALTSNTTGYNNTAIGIKSLNNNTTGDYNTAIGAAALSDVNTAIYTGYNTAIGYNTGRGITTGINNTIIGAQVTGLAAGLSNNIIIADGSGNQRINVGSTGNVGIGTTSPLQQLDLVSGSAYGIAGTSVLNATTLGTGVTTSSLTTVGILASGSIATGFGNISTANLITTSGTIGTAATTTFTGAGATFTSIANSGGYTQTNTSANAFTGTSTFSNATYSALFTGGNVGIGTTGPSYKLDVSGGSGIVGQFSGRVIGGNAVGTNEFVTLSQLTGGTGQYWSKSGTNLSPTTAGDDIYLPTNSILGIGYDPTTISGGVMAISGNVGIGTTDPGAKLSVYNSGAFDAAYINQAGTGSALSLYSNTGATGWGALLSLNIANSAFEKEGIYVSNSGTGPSLALIQSSTGVGGALFAYSNVDSTVNEPLINFQVANSAFDKELMYLYNNGASIGINLYNSGTGQPMLINQAGNSRAFEIYSNVGAPANDHLVVLNADNAAFDQNVLYINNDGIGSGIYLNNTNTGVGLNIAGSGTGNLASMDTTSTTANGLYLDIQSSSASQYGLKVTTNNGSTNAFGVYGNGNVGIGTTAPSRILDVNGNIILPNNTALMSKDSDGVDRGAQLIRSAPNGFVYIADSARSIVLDTGASFNTLIPNGNVGIGTTSPSNLFSVGTTSQFQINSSGFALLPQGLVGTPALAFVGDPDTGLWQSALNILNFSTGGSERMRIDSNGNVGIGTTVTTSELSIGGSSSTISNSSGNLTITPAANLIISSGNVGIGTTSPLQKLEVTGAGYFSSGAYIGANSTNNLISTASTGASSTQLYIGNLPIATVGGGGSGSITGATNQVGYFTGTDTLGGSNNFWFNGTNVGIGTTNPSAMLSVGATSQFQVNSSGAIAAVTGVTTSGGYTQSGISANTFTGTSTFNNATYSALFTGGSVGIGTATPVGILEVASYGDSLFLTDLTSYAQGVGGRLWFRGYQTATTFAIFAEINGIKENGTINDGKGALVFMTNNDASGESYSPAERMRITAAGNVGIGNTAPGAMLDLGTVGTLGVIRLAGSTSGNVSINPQAVAGANKIVTLPNASGTVAVSASAPAVLNATTGNITINMLGDLATTAPITGAASNIFTGTNGVKATIALDLTAAIAWTGTHTFSNATYSALFTGGNVGIGTTNPLAMLSVKSTGTTDLLNLIETGGTEVFTVLENGNVGIGITAPGVKLSVDGDTNIEGIISLWSMDTIRSMGSTLQIGAASDYETLALFTIGEQRITVNSSGNVGIGTTNPLQTLDMKAGGTYGYNGQIMAQASTTLNNWFFGNAGNPTLSLITGNQNTAVGSGALSNITSGSLNTAIGYNAMNDASAAWNSTAIGVSTLSNNYGSNNIAIGFRAGTGWSELDGYSNGSNNIIIGHNIDLPAQGSSNMLSIGNLIYATDLTAFSSVSNSISTGNVGIGTASPGFKLEVNGNIKGDYLYASGGTSTWPSITFSTPSFTQGLGFYNPAENVLGIVTNSAEALRIDSAGNVGIGTTAPTEVLQIANDDDTFLNIHAITGSGQVSGIKLQRGTWLTDSYSDYSIYNQAGEFKIDYLDSSSTTNRLTINGSGNVNISTLGTGTVYSSSGTLTNTAPSDANLKKDITPLGSSLDKVMALNPVSFNWKSDGSADYGFIAQDVQQVLPELVRTDPNTGTLGLLSMEFIPYLTKAIQEQQVMINNIQKAYQLDDQGRLIISSAKIDKLVISGDVDLGSNATFQTNNMAISLSNTDLRLNNLEESITLSSVWQSEIISTQSAAIAETRSQVDVLSASIASMSAQIADLKSQVASNNATSSASLIASASATPTPTPSTSVQDVASLNLTPPEILLATQSAHLVDLTVTSDATISGKLTAYQAVISDSFKSLGETFLGNTTVAGNFSVDGTLSVTGDSLTTLGTLHVQNGPLADTIDFFNGQVTIDKMGKLLAQNIEAKTVTTEKLIIDAKSLGEATIPTGQTEIPVFTSAVNQKSKIFLTPTSPTDGQSLIMSGIVDTSGFVVSLEQIYSQDIKFNWMIIDSQ